MNPSHPTVARAVRLALCTALVAAAHVTGPASSLLTAQVALAAGSTHEPALTEVRFDSGRWSVADAPPAPDAAAGDTGPPLTTYRSPARAEHR